MTSSYSFAHAGIGGALERNISGDQTPQCVGQRGAGRVQHGQMIQASGTQRWRIAAATLPGIKSDVVMITAGGNESRLRSPALHQLKAEHAQ